MECGWSQNITVEVSVGRVTECNLDVWVGPKVVKVECGWSQNITVEVSVDGDTECNLDVWVGP